MAICRFSVLMIILSVLTFTLGGCAMSVEDRIKVQQQAFDAYPADVQARLKQRQIRLGDDQNAVWIAFGAPSEKQYRIDDTGRVDIWIYKYLTHDPTLTPRVRPVYRDIGGRLRGDYYIDDSHEYIWKESLRVEFKNGRVTTIQGVD